MMRGRDQIRLTHQRIHEGAYRHSTLAAEPLEFTQLAEGIAVLLFRTTLKLNGTQNDGEVVETVAQAVMVEHEREWLIRSLINAEIKRPG